MLNNNQRTILILGARAPISLELCRSFARAGHIVLLGDSFRFPVSRFSKYCSSYYLLPSPALETEIFHDKLITLVKSEGIDDIIPTSEEAFYLSQIKQDLKCKVWVSEFLLMDTLHNKLNFIEFSKTFFITPDTISLDDFSEYDMAKDYVFKPKYSRFGENIIMNKTYNYINKKINSKNTKNWIAQEKIIGTQICTYSIFDNGSLKQTIAYKPKYLYKNGASMLFEPFLDYEVFQQIENFGKSIGYTGQLSFDFILKNEKAYVIECNPRGTSGAHLIGDGLEKCFFADKNNLLNVIKKSKALKLPILIDRPFAYRNIDYKKAKDVIYDRHDILPFFGQFISVIELFLKKIITGKKLSDITTYDIVYNGKKQ